MALRSDGLDLPSVAGALDLIASELRDGRSVLVLLPAGQSKDGIINEIESRLHREFAVDRFTISDSTTGSNPQDQIKFYAKQFESTSSKQPSVSPDVLIIEGLAEISKDHQRDFLNEVMTQWSAYRLPTDPVELRRSLLVVEHANRIHVPPPPADTTLAIRWWWGLPSELETRLFARLVFSQDPNSFWKESILAALSPGDLGLAGSLITHSPESIQAVIPWLCDYARTHGMDELIDTSENSMRAQIASITDAPELGQTSNWAKGGLAASHEFGVEPHVVSLALAGNQDAVNRRIWRAQSPMVWPIVESVRWSVCQLLIEFFDNKWFTRCEAPDNQKELERLEKDPYDAELGYLAHILRTTMLNPPLQKWRQSIELFLAARNDVAHYRPLDRDRLESIRREWAK